MDEEWRPIPGQDGWYDISSTGRIRSWKSGRQGRRSEPRILSLMTDGKGYLFFNVVSGSRPGMIRVHRVMCEAWHGSAPDAQSLARHLNDDRLDNRPENLAWGSRADNAADAVGNGRITNRHIRVLTDAQVIGIRRAWGMRSASQAKLAIIYGVSEQTIAGVVHGRTYADVLPD